MVNVADKKSLTVLCIITTTNWGKWWKESHDQSHFKTNVGIADVLLALRLWTDVHEVNKSQEIYSYFFMNDLWCVSIWRKKEYYFWKMSTEFPVVGWWRESTCVLYKTQLTIASTKSMAWRDLDLVLFLLLGRHLFSGSSRRRDRVVGSRRREVWADEERGAHTKWDGWGVDGDSLHPSG